MAVPIDANLHDTTLRRSRSTGDVPRFNAIHQHQLSRHPGSHSDVGDDHLAFRSQPSTSPYHLNGEIGRGESSPSSPAPAPHPRVLPPASSRLHENTIPVIPPAQPRRAWYNSMLTSLGLGRGASRERRSLVGLFLNLASGSSQIIAITIVLGLTGTTLKSPTEPTLTEWEACSRPLGIWACIWVVRALLACSLNYWGFIRERQIHHRRTDPSSSDSIRAATSPSSRHVGGATNAPHTLGHNDTPISATLPYTLLYSRLTLLSSLLTLSWFLTAHILEYTSVNTCRHSSPHVWWLIFGILCLMYLMVLEVLLLGLVVFIVAPVLFLCWNIILICTGRHPLQTGNMIKPEVGKLPKTIVDSIPLVMYIPPPPNAPLQEKVTVPEPVYSYPPKPRPPPITASRTRFRFISRISSSFQPKKDKDLKTPSSPTGEGDVEKNGEPHTWEEHWEQGEYPFVILEGNRAACAICLMDFEEPKRVPGTSLENNTPAAADAAPPTKSEPDLPENAEISEARVTSTNDERYVVHDELKLADAGEGAQPLRLLACGHVFHKTCLDPWLTDVSGRCPVCQRAVELPKDKKAKKERRRNAG